MENQKIDHLYDMRIWLTVLLLLFLAVVKGQNRDITQTFLWKYGNQYAKNNELISKTIIANGDTLFHARFDSSSFELRERLYLETYERFDVYPDGSKAHTKTVLDANYTKRTFTHANGRVIQEYSQTEAQETCKEFDPETRVCTYSSILGKTSGYISYTTRANMNYYRMSWGPDFSEEMWIDSSTIYPIIRTKKVVDHELTEETFKALNFSNYYHYFCQTGEYAFSYQTDSGYYSIDHNEKRTQVTISTNEGNYIYRTTPTGVRYHDILTQFGREIAEWRNDTLIYLNRLYHQDGNTRLRRYKTTEFRRTGPSEGHTLVELYEQVGNGQPTKWYIMDLDSNVVDRSPWIQWNWRERKGRKRQKKNPNVPTIPSDRDIISEPNYNFPKPVVQAFYTIQFSTPPDLFPELITIQKGNKIMGWSELISTRFQMQKIDASQCEIRCSATGEIQVRTSNKQDLPDFLRWLDGAAVFYGRNAQIIDRKKDGTVETTDIENQPIQVNMTIESYF